MILNDIKDSFYKISITLNSEKKKILKEIASEILQNGYMLDMYVTKQNKTKP